MAQSKNGENLVWKGRPASSGSDDVPPREQPNVTPRDVGYDHSFLLQAIMENQRTLGELKEATQALKTEITRQGAKIEKHGAIIASASGATVIILAIFGFLIDKMWDKIAALLTLTISQ